MIAFEPESEFARARRIADAVLYEGYVLYPYRASSRKNRFRWAFGVLAPRPWCEAGGCESAWMQTEALVEREGPLHLGGRLRFLRVERREVQARKGSSFVPVESLEVRGEKYLTWEEGIETEIDFEVDDVAREILFEATGAEESRELRDEADRVIGRVVRTVLPIEGRIRVAVTPTEIADLRKVRVVVSNETRCKDLKAARDVALRGALVGAHLILSARSGQFISLLDPPPAVREATRECENIRTFPVLAGPIGHRSLLLASPIVLYDHPEIAPESAGELYDSTEIDELLMLRTLTLTEEEKREARATDPRSAALLDRVEATPDAQRNRLHGRTVMIGQSEIGKGSRVRLRPGARRSDPQDMFLTDRTAVVEEVRHDVDGRAWLAVTLVDDPGADLHRWYGRHLHFQLDEVEPL